jgi:hypothetical protein
MQNLRKLSILTIAIICTNYFSTMAQEERKAFEEGDKVISIGVSGGSIGSILSGILNNSYNTQKFSPAISFDYGLKGTRGLLSIGGFASYSRSNISGYNSFGGYGYIVNSPSDTLFVSSNFGGLKISNFTAGIRLGIHYSTRKWDLYAGAMIGNRTTISEYGKSISEYYKGTLQFPNQQLIKTDVNEPRTITNSTYFISPYSGARYYVTKKVSLNLEVGQFTGNVGLGFKF